MRGFKVGLAAMLLSSSAFAAEPPPAFRWRGLPNSAEVLTPYPALAASAPLPPGYEKTTAERSPTYWNLATVTVACKTSAGGALGECRVMSATGIDREEFSKRTVELAGKAAVEAERPGEVLPEVVIFNAEYFRLDFPSTGLQPRWAERPSTEQFDNLITPRTYDDGMSVSAMVTCEVVPKTGVLKKCAQQATTAYDTDVRLEYLPHYLRHEPIRGYWGRKNPTVCFVLRTGTTAGIGDCTAPQGKLFDYTLSTPAPPLVGMAGDDVVVPTTSRLYPRRAYRMEKLGSARLRCTLKTDGELSACQTLSETPQGYQFGDAALKAAPHVRHARPVSGREETIELNVQFKLEGDWPRGLIQEVIVGG